MYVKESACPTVHVVSGPQEVLRGREYTERTQALQRTWTPAPVLVLTNCEVSAGSCAL